jgi:hypothetical protein
VRRTGFALFWLDGELPETGECSRVYRDGDEVVLEDAGEPHRYRRVPVERLRWYEVTEWREIPPGGQREYEAVIAPALAVIGRAELLEAPGPGSRHRRPRPRG